MESVSILKVTSYQDQLPEKITRLLAPLGGLGRFCKSGERVLLKPNFIIPHAAASAATTHPDLILALVKLLLDQGCRVAVGDSPGFGSAAAVAKKIGLVEGLKPYGVEIIEFETRQPASAFRPGLNFEKRFKNLQLAGELLQFDRIINLPKLKAHGQMGLTLATKNLYGCIIGLEKGQWHFAAGKDRHLFARLLVEVALTVNATLHILDGIIGMDGNGPSNGRPRQLNLLLAAANPLALDRVVVELLQQKPEDFPLFAAARELGVPGLDLNQIKIEGEPVANCLVKDFEIPALLASDLVLSKTISLFLEGLIKSRIQLDRSLCTKCRLCERICPAGAITFQERIKIDPRRCIQCCCCQEVCPAGALTVRNPWLMRLLRRLGVS